MSIHEVLTDNTPKDLPLVVKDRFMAPSSMCPCGEDTSSIEIVFEGYTSLKGLPVAKFRISAEPAPFFLLQDNLKMLTRITPPKEADL